MAKQWVFHGHDRAAILELANRAGIEFVVAQLLYARGVNDSVHIASFLEARFGDLRDPFILPGMTKAAEHIFASIKAGKAITVYGDYDADGMTGVSILFNCLQLLGANVNYYVPNRLEDSYGLSCDALEKLAERGRQLVISVDCGVGSVKEAARCRELGLELIITDHHRASDQLPDAIAIVHPGLPGTEYPFPGLCGAGVAFKLAWALCQLASDSKKVAPAMREMLLECMSLAAIGTVADVVPLLDENRILVRNALTMMTKSAPLGLKALMRRTKLDAKSQLSSDDIAFTLGPRLNAAGRLGQAQLGIELLTTKDPERAEALAEYIDRLNSDRESLERSIVLAANKQIKDEFDIENDPAFVLASPGWHLGVIGVAASRLAEKLYRPVVVIGMDPTGQKPATGSARSQGTCDLHSALLACKDHLESCGGHAAAAGLRIQERNISAFRSAFCEHVSTLQRGIRPIAKLDIDAEVSFKELSLHTVQTIDKLSPFGAGNPRPTLVASNVELLEPAKAMGAGDRHMQVVLHQNGVRMRAIAFGQSEWIEPLNSHRGQFDIAFRPSINEFNGMKRVEIQLMDWRVAKLGPNDSHLATINSGVTLNT